LTLAGKLAFATGQHRSEDIYKLALYGPQATHNAHTESYTKEHECKGQGYVAGGQALQGYSATIEGTHAVVGWTKDTLWKNASICARYGIIYNARTGTTVMIIDISDEQGNPVTSTNGNFKVEGGIAAWIG
jgi:hypothetical protein